MKYFLIALAFLVGIALTSFFFIYSNEESFNKDSDEPDVSVTDSNLSGDTPIPVEPDGGIGDGAEPLPQLVEGETVIGQSVRGTDIKAYHYGTGETEVLFVGGIHGGYSWNTVRLMQELVDHLEDTDNAVPDSLRVTVVPLLNPDGLQTVTDETYDFTVADIPPTLAETIPGRFNDNEVDLNRNFDCEWEEEGTWQSRSVSGGTEPFSEPESRAIRDYIESNGVDAVVVYYSSAGGVFASNCRNGVLDETAELTDLYAEASGYPAFQSFNFYEITGDMVNWLAKKEIPGISVLLTSHNNVEWEKNLPGIEAVLEYYAE